MPPGIFTRKPFIRPSNSFGSTIPTGSGRFLMRKYRRNRMAGLFPTSSEIEKTVLSRGQKTVRIHLVPLDRDALIRLCERYRISELSLFGSIVRDDFDPRRSDVDVLVEFLPDSPVRGFGFRDELGIFTLKDTLEEMFHRKVDLVQKEGLDRYIKEDVLRRRMVICKYSDDGRVLFMTKQRDPGDVSGPSADRTPRKGRGTDAFVGIEEETAAKVRQVKKPDMYLLHIRDDCQKILKFTAEMTSGDFAANEVVQLAVAKLMEQIGENAGKLSKPFRQKHSGVSWKQWIASRHLIVHVYEDILMDTMWDTVTEHIPKLLADINDLLQEVVDGAQKKE